MPESVYYDVTVAGTSPEQGHGHHRVIMSDASVTSQRPIESNPVTRPAPARPGSQCPSVRLGARHGRIGPSFGNRCDSEQQATVTVAASVPLMVREVPLRPGPALPTDVGLEAGGAPALGLDVTVSASAATPSRRRRGGAGPGRIAQACPWQGRPHRPDARRGPSR